MIDIILACYNGEKYIHTQITSIINQTYKDWCLYIHDDGSTDRTIDTVKRFAAMDDRIVYIDDGIKSLGAGGNFLHTLKYSKNRYVCFSDQDDYWFENKLEKQFDIICREVEDKPVLVFCDAYAWSYPQNRIYKIFNQNYPRSLYDVLFRTGGLQGAACIFNVAARSRLLMDFEYVWMHDHYLLLICILFGKIIYCRDRLLLYRRHTDNVTPAVDRSRFDLLRKILIVNSQIPVVFRPSYESIQEFFNIFQMQMSARNRKIIKTFLNFPFENKIKRFIKILFSPFTIGGHSHIALICKLLLRKKFI